MTRVRAAFARLLPEAGDVVAHAGDGYRLLLPPEVVLDVDVLRADAAFDAAAAALESGDYGEAARLATDARVVLGHQFLPGEEGPWVAEIRHELHTDRVQALEFLARAGSISTSPPSPPPSPPRRSGSSPTASRRTGC
jgi:hypothetical protein